MENLSGMENNTEIHKCDYGCGQEAKFQFKNGKWCCSEFHRQCPQISKIIENKLKEKWKNKVHPNKGNIPWNKGKKCVQIGWNKGLTKKNK